MTSTAEAKLTLVEARKVDRFLRVPIPNPTYPARCTGRRPGPFMASDPAKIQAFDCESCRSGNTYEPVEKNGRRWITRGPKGTHTLPGLEPIDVVAIFIGDDILFSNFLTDGRAYPG